MRMIQLPAQARARSQLASAATSDPKCSGPVGDGAKRPRYPADGSSVDGGAASGMFQCLEATDRRG